MSDLHRQIVIETFQHDDEAIRAIQELKLAGFEPSSLTIAGRDRDEAARIADLTGVSTTDEWPDSGRERGSSNRFRLVVKAGDHAALARRIISDGVIDAAGMDAQTSNESHHDPNTGTGADVATSTDTRTGISCGPSREGNTRSTAETSAGKLGQDAQGADALDDDVPG